MKIAHLLRTAALTLATCGMLVPRYQALAAEVAQPARPQTAPAVLDVALDGQGQLQGQVVTPQGTPVAGAPVILHRDAKEVASTRTNEAGQFTVANLRGGNYHLAAGESAGVYRVWTADSAPPAARPGVLIVSGSKIARGQSGGGGGAGLVMLGLAGAIVTAGVVTQESGSGS